MKAKIERRPNEALRRERLRHHWTQQELAERIGTTVVTISHWEGGLRIPGPHFSQRLCDLFEKSSEALGLLHEAKAEARRDASEEESTADEPGAVPTPSAATTGPFWCVHYRRNPFFTSRDALLTHLHATLQTGDTVASARLQAISGLGGMGKTQSALEYAYRFREEYQAVLWARAETSEVLIADLMNIAEVLALPEHKDPEQPRVVKAVKRWLSQHTGWLLILDNVEDINLIHDFLSFEIHGHVLLTMRSRVVGTLAQRIDLEPMQPEEGVLFLLRRAKLLTIDATLQEVDPAVYQAAEEIHQFMGGLPLALDQAGAYIEATQCSLFDYLRLLHSSHLRLLAERDVHTDHPLSVSRTFTLTFERLERDEPLAAALLTVCAFLAPEAIPETFFLEGATSLGSPLDPLQFNAAIKALLAYSLLQRDAATGTVTVHRLVQAVLKGHLSETEQRTWATRLVEAMLHLFPLEDTHIDYWRFCERLLSHALACLTLIEQWEGDEESRITLMSHVAAYLSRRARYQEAEPLLQRALHMGEQVLGSEHPQCAYILQELAEIYREHGKYEQAEPLFLQALHIREQALGVNHLLVAESLTKMGNFYRWQDKYEQAEPLYQRALDIVEQMSESEPPLIVSLLSNRGILYLMQGKYEQAEPFFLLSLQIAKHILRSEHPQLASSLSHLGFLYFLQGKYEQAEPLLQQCLQINEQIFGSEHPRVARFLNNLGTLHQKQGKYEQAEPLLLQALQINEQIFGSEHPELASALHGLGILYCEQGKYEQAESLLLRTLQISEQAFGSEHLLLAYPLHGLANLYREQAHYEQAGPLYQRALAIRQQYQGQQHPEVAEILHDFACFFQVQQQTTEALSLYRQALTIREQAPGPSHPDTMKTRSALAHLLQVTGYIEDATTLKSPVPAEE